MASIPTNRKLLLDENFSWRIGRDLAKAGYDVLNTTQANLAGFGDHLVFQRAQQLQCIILTRDSDFLTRFAPPHHGIIVLVCESTIGNRQIIERLLESLPNLLAQNVTDTITLINIPRACRHPIFRQQILRLLYQRQQPSISIQTKLINTSIKNIMSILEIHFAHQLQYHYIAIAFEGISPTGIVV